MDGSPTVFLAWDKNEPGFANYDENCVVMTSAIGKREALSVHGAMIVFPVFSLKLDVAGWPSRWDVCVSTGFWVNTNCGRPMPSVCKRDSGSPPNATLPPPMSKGGCVPGWTHFDGKVRALQYDGLYFCTLDRSCSILPVGLPCSSLLCWSSWRPHSATGSLGRTQTSRSRGKMPGITASWRNPGWLPSLVKKNKVWMSGAHPRGGMSPWEYPGGHSGSVASRHCAL